eukprot:4274218-Prymnesium_polylepis.1
MRLRSGLDVDRRSTAALASLVDCTARNSSRTPRGPVRHSSARTALAFRTAPWMRIAACFASS